MAMVLFNVQYKHPRARRWRSSDLRQICTDPPKADRIIQALAQEAQRRAQADRWAERAHHRRALGWMDRPLTANNHKAMSCFRFDHSAISAVDRRRARAAALHMRPPSRRPARQALPRAESLIDTAFLWREFAAAAGCRFDVEQKALDAIVFTLAAGGTSLAMPSKLEGTARRSRVCPALHLLVSAAPGA